MGVGSEPGVQDHALEAVWRWLVCVAAASVAARRRIGQWYILSRQRLWWGGMVLKEWEAARWKRFF